jgi:hypothetical protein
VTLQNGSGVNQCLSISSPQTGEGPEISISVILFSLFMCKYFFPYTRLRLCTKEYEIV